MTPYGEQCREMVKASLAYYQLPDTEPTIKLLCMTAAHESGQFRYCRQVKGPAQGLFQMEPATYKDVMDYIRKRTERFEILAEKTGAPSHLMIFDPMFGCAMARVHYLRVPQAIPGTNNLMGLADYCKKYWNTFRGKATPGDYYKAFLRDFG